MTFELRSQVICNGCTIDLLTGPDYLIRPEDVLLVTRRGLQFDWPKLDRELFLSDGHQIHTSAITRGHCV